MMERLGEEQDNWNILLSYLRPVFFGLSGGTSCYLELSDLFRYPRLHHYKLFLHAES
jgi:hypothetical protein